MILTLRIINKENSQMDYWYEVAFSAVIVANGHYSVPKIPKVPGLANAQKKNSELIQHASSFRNTEGYENKTILMIGTGTSATDIVSYILGVSKTPICGSCRGDPGQIFSKALADNTKIEIKPGISEIEILKDGTKVMAQFTDESTICVGKILLATGYLYDFPFLRKQEVIVNENNRVEGLYQHIFKIGDPSLSFWELWLPLFRSEFLSTKLL